MKHGAQIQFGVILAAAAAIALTVPAGLDRHQAHTLAIVLVTLGLWSTGLVPAFLGTLIFFTLLLIPGLASPELVFSGFTAPAIWLVMSGFVLVAAIRVTGLGTRLGNAAAPHLSRSYPGLIAGLVAMGAALGFLMPSSVGRSMALVPIGMALAEALGFERGSNGRTGVALAVAFGCNIPSFAILPANLPNMVLSGAAAHLHGISIGYTDYLVLHYPVLGILKSVAIVALILRAYPARTGAPAAVAAPAPEDAGGGTRQQLWLLGLLFVTLALWATDRFHGINPAWIGLAAAVILLLPRVGLVSPEAFRSAIDFGTLLLVAGVLGLGAVVSASGLGERLAELVTSVLPLAPGRDFANFLSLSALATLTALISTMPGVPAVLTPLAPDLAAATGFSVEAVLMTQVIGFSTVNFPYQVAPLIVAMGLAGEPVRALLRVTLALALLTFVLLVPLDFLWWKLLGWI